LIDKVRITDYKAVMKEDRFFIFSVLE